MYTTEVELAIKAPAQTVWQWLTDPALVTQYLFGTHLETDWVVGSPITYSGEWEGKPYQDKGTVLAFDPPRLLRSTYFSAMSGLEDKLENYQQVTFELTDSDGGTLLRLSQTNAKDQASADHSAENWRMILASMKQLIESA